MTELFGLNLTGSLIEDYTHLNLRSGGSKNKTSFQTFTQIRSRDQTFVSELSLIFFINSVSLCHKSEEYALDIKPTC